jgi:hypothetical protein
MLEGLADDLSAGVGAELGQDVRDVGLHGVAGQEQLGGDVWVGPADGDQAGDLGLGGGKRVPPLGRPRPLSSAAPPDAVAAQPGIGAAQVPRRAQVGVEPGRGADGGQVGGRRPLPGAGEW